MENLDYENELVENEINMGVFICACGNKIGGVLDVDALREQTAQLPGVNYSAVDSYPCSKDGLIRIKKAVEDHQLERVLVAGCTPRLMQKHFERALTDAGIKPEYFLMVDIREQCVYPHADDLEGAFNKAVEQIAMGVANLSTVESASWKIQDIVKHTAVIGSSLEGMTCALSLAEAGVPVFLIERGSSLGESANLIQEDSYKMVADNVRKVEDHAGITSLTNTKVIKVTGSPGKYSLLLGTGENSRKHIESGTIIIASGAHPAQLGGNRWYDRSKVMNQAEFEGVLSNGGLFENDNDHYVFIIHNEATHDCSGYLVCQTALRQAVELRQKNPKQRISILIPDCCYQADTATNQKHIALAKRSGVNIHPYRETERPVLEAESIKYINVEEKIATINFDKVVLSTFVLPNRGARSLASLLHLPMDENGFIQKSRRRLRPERYVNDGIFLMGSVKKPVDTGESLFDAYLTTSRVLHFLNQEKIEIKSPTAEINSDLCTGCGNCVQVCPTDAIELISRDSLLSRAEVNVLRCIGCGSCMVSCPVNAIKLPGLGNEQILSQIEAALQSQNIEEPRFLAFTCEWGAYAAADLAGANRIQYPSSVRIIRMNCSARFDPYHVLWAFLKGADGVFLGACPPGECHYGESNLIAMKRLENLSDQLKDHGFDPGRLMFEYIPGDDGEKLAELLTKFVNKYKKQEEVFLKNLNIGG